jgi:predicted DNA-binding transcriptional regulator YafY
MAQKLSYERYYWLHHQIRSGRYPNARTLCEEFEISQKQAQREIEFMRERLGAPLHFNTEHRGYEYSASGYELPPVWFNEEELASLCLAARLADAIPDARLKNSLHELLEKFLSFRSIGSPPKLQDVEDKVSLKNIEYYKVKEDVFRLVVGALFQGRPVNITYRTPYTGEETRRIILPLHLLCYMGNWYLIAFCSLKGQVRDFALSRIRAIETSSGPIDLPADLPRIKDYLRNTFGVLSGEVSIEVSLRFVAGVSDWIAEQIWHEAQEIDRDPDGSLHLKFKVSDFREVRREILKYGSSVEVLSPPELRKEVAREIKKMMKVYT